jgi:hypothetical protein
MDVRSSPSCNPASIEGLDAEGARLVEVQTVAKGRNDEGHPGICKPSASVNFGQPNARVVGQSLA